MKITDNYKFTLIVEFPRFGGKVQETIEVDPHFATAIKKIKECDHIMTRMLTGDAMHEEASQQRRERKRIVSEIAMRLADLFIKHLETQDTLNGYPAPERKESE